MKPVKGRAAVVLPQGVLFREKKEYEMRKKMIESDKLECVITLANNLFYGADIPACLLIFREGTESVSNSLNINIENL